MRITLVITVSVVFLTQCGSDNFLRGDAGHDTRLDSASDRTDGDTNAGDLPWSPGIDGFGEQGWRDSAEPWCPAINGLVMSYDVWSSHDAVYILVADNQNTGMTYEDMNHLYANDGTGWRLAYEELASSISMYDTTCFRNIMGLPDGPILAWASPSQSCDLALIRDGAVEWVDFEVWDVFAVNENLAYAIASFGDIKVIMYDGVSWQPIPSVVPYSVMHIWADEGSVFAAGTGGTIVSLEGDEWKIHDTGTVAYITSIWGFSGHDVWVGQDDSILRHFDGETWRPVEWPNVGDPGHGSINGMWGKDGILFFFTTYQLTMWDGTGFSVLGYWEDEDIFINAIWGNSPDELFIAVTDERHQSEDCGPEYVMWWDGALFHWF